ncbi:Detected protein of unknown function [Hibiscus syriacus]|uniref:Uncharacterized protein n=1 Tax=Hibiscus syriacus TaxID=106335 RepID=A0A6A3C478_HIBSY|nr:uncharacterized protein LOC120205014 [Hibiscus syriacus]KAE8723696.1 Detected protein of unknown function [Hibiscus syriacus]
MTSELENLSKKRKLEESLGGDEGSFMKRLKSVFDMELQLETRLPSEWQRCLDLQSELIHFYNTMTRTRTCKVQSRSPEPTSTGHISLDLELNHPCDLLRKVNASDHRFITRVDSVDEQINCSMRNLSWLVTEENEEERKEMVAIVCSRCYMLVMLIKSSPACPN